MSRRYLPMLLACVAASAWGQECNSIAADADRLRCYDIRFPRSPQAPESAAAPASVTPPGNVEPPPIEAGMTLPRFLKNLRLANEATPSGTLRSEPASFGFARLNGQEYSSVQAALIWEPSESWFREDTYFSDYGWGPFASYSINRNTLSTKRADTRQGAIGLYGTAFRIPGEKPAGSLIAPIALAMLTKVEVAGRQNKVDGTDSMVYTVDNWFVSRALFDGIPYSSPLAWFVSPRLGLQEEDRRRAKTGNPLGSTRSVFGQIKADLFPGQLSDRLKFSLLAQRYVDLAADAGIAERAENFWKIGGELLLYPPRATNTVQPSLALERSVGADLLNGLPRQGLTQLVFKLKLN